jgi:hypothetical protein
MSHRGAVADGRTATTGDDRPMAQLPGTCVAEPEPVRQDLVTQADGGSVKTESALPSSPDCEAAGNEGHRR